MPADARETTTAFRILAAISFCHLLNDMMQSVIPAVYPTDHRPTPYSLPVGMTFTMVGLLLFVFLGAVAAGTVIGGPVGDRIGRIR